MNYVDVKVTLWQRLEFEEHTIMKEIINLIKTEGIDSITSHEDAPQYEDLLDTLEQMTPMENDHQATIEVYENGKPIWSNAE